MLSKLMGTMIQQRRGRPSGWWFPAKTTAYFVVVAAISLGVLSLLGLQRIRSANEGNSAVRIDRAGRAAAALLEAQLDVSVVSNADGSPMSIMVETPGLLEPDPTWDELLDSIGAVNQGAANLFRFEAETNSFARLSTTFRTPEGERVGGSQVEPGLITVGHPAFASITDGTPYIGEVPVAGRLRLAYLTPIVDTDGGLAGILAVDVGWVDDLNRINGEAADRALAATLILLGVFAIVSILVMFCSFRPLYRLTEVAYALASGDDGPSIQLTGRRDEIGYLARGLTKVAELQRSLEHRAYNDALTAIPNRAALVQELEKRFKAIEAGDPTATAFALLIIDLDGFKEVNDGLGHQSGDELLRSVATSLKRSLRPGEFVARLGGDEFAVLSAFDASIESSLDELASRAASSSSGTFETRAGDARVTASIGIALVPEHGTSTAEVMSHADLALYGVKRKGRGAAMVYEPHLSASFKRHLYLVSELRRALDQESLRLEYQPLYGIDGQLCSLEGLARWTHEVEGPIPPSEFIPIAESVGLIDQLGNWALEEGCRQLGIWAAESDDVPQLSINVSILQLRNPSFVESIARLLDRYPAARGRLCIELTESALLPSENDWYRDVLRSLSSMGVELAIDDFGTGYSSLSYLHELVVDQVKIDRSFVVSATEDPRQALLLSGIVGLGKSLGLAVVLEGVETVEELDLAKSLGCDLVQGYLLGRSMPPDAVAPLFGISHPQFNQLPVHRSVR